MPNVKHQSKRVECYTPPAILALARAVTGPFELDPASTLSANRLVQATRIYTKRDHALRQEWKSAGPVWLNPPGGVLDKKTLRPVAPGRRGLSSAGTFWEYMRDQFARGYFTAGWFLSFTLEQLSISQAMNSDYPEGVLEFPTLVFAKRVRFVDRWGRPIRTNDPTTGKRRSASPTHHNALTLVTRQPALIERFRDVVLHSVEHFDPRTHAPRGVIVRSIWNDV